MEQTDDIALSQTLLAPVTLLSSHLVSLRSTLSERMVTKIYRRIASRLAEHILQREILYRGHISLREGKAIFVECELWLETCHAALGGSRNRVDAPWLKLLQAGRLISAEGDSWEKILDLTSTNHGEEAWTAAMVDVVGLNKLGREEVERILRSRDEYH